VVVVNFHLSITANIGEMALKMNCPVGKEWRHRATRRDAGLPRRSRDCESITFPASSQIGILSHSFVSVVMAGRVGRMRAASRSRFALRWIRQIFCARTANRTPRTNITHKSISHFAEAFAHNDIDRSTRLEHAKDALHRSFSWLHFLTLVLLNPHN